MNCLLYCLSELGKVWRRETRRGSNATTASSAIFFYILYTHSEALSFAKEPKASSVGTHAPPKPAYILLYPVHSRCAHVSHTSFCSKKHESQWSAPSLQRRFPFSSPVGCLCDNRAARLP